MKKFFSFGLPAIMLSVVVFTSSGCGLLQKNEVKGGYWKADEGEVQLAILPFVVRSLSDTLPRFNTVSELRDADRSTGILLQRDFYRYCLRKMNSYDYPNSFIQDPNKTNKMLEPYEINIDDLEDKDLADVSQILGVEGVICGFVDHRYPDKSTVSGLLNGGLRGQVMIESNIYWYDTSRERRRWRHNSQLPKANGKEDYTLTKDLLREASARFPF